MSTDGLFKQARRAFTKKQKNTFKPKSLLEPVYRLFKYIFPDNIPDIDI